MKSKPAALITVLAAVIATIFVTDLIGSEESTEASLATEAAPTQVGPTPPEWDVNHHISMGLPPYLSVSLSTDMVVDPDLQIYHATIVTITDLRTSEKIFAGISAGLSTPASLEEVGTRPQRWVTTGTTYDPIHEVSPGHRSRSIKRYTKDSLVEMKRLGKRLPEHEYIDEALLKD